MQKLCTAVRKLWKWGLKQYAERMGAIIVHWKTGA